jgi:non-ribosomal peptide synthetase component E (peptide arylation enzyme)
MFQTLEGAVPHLEEDAQEYNDCRWWSGLTLGDLLDRAAQMHPKREAFVDQQHRLTYAEAKERADRLAISLTYLGI